MASVNKVIVLGNVGRDPELKYTPTGMAVCNITLATSRSWKDKASGDKQEETEWHRIVFYDKLAEVVGQYVVKGKPLYVEGRLKTRKWQDKEGKDNYTTEIIAEQIQLLGGRESDPPSSPAGAAQTQKTGAKPAPAPRPQTGFDDMDDDILF